MKKIRLLLIATLLVSIAFGQKSSWVTYFPAQNNIIGQMCVGASQNDLAFSRIPELEIELETYKSYDALDKEQKKSLALKFGEAFQLNRIKVSNVFAKNIYADRIKAEKLSKVSPGVQFVYSGLRADTVSIVFERERNIQANPKEIAEKVKTVFPNLTTLQIEELLATELKDSTKTKFTLTISDPTVYFMIQAATIKLEKMTSLSGNEYVQPFGEYSQGNCDINVNSFTLNSQSPTSCDAKAIIPSGSGAEVAMTLRVTSGKLVLRHQLSDYKTTRDKDLIFEDNRLIDNLGMFVYRYPFETKRKEIKFKEVYLFIDATRKGNDFEILNKASNYNFPTRISYPNSIIEIRRWRQ
jgi:hypothetical protein